MPIPLGILAVAGAGAAGGGAAYELIETIETTSNTVSFTNIPQNYKHLQIRAIMRATSGNYRIWMRLNGATTSYWSHEIQGFGTGVSSYNQNLNAMLEFNLPGAVYGDSSSIYAAAVIDLLDYSSSSKKTTARALWGKHASEKSVALQSGLWDSTNAVTSITMLAVETGIVAKYSLYGIKG